LTAYNDPSSVTVHRLNADGTIGEEVAPGGKLDTGIYAHQIRTTPSNEIVLLVTRGNNAAPGKPEDPGAIKTFRFKNGILANIASIAPGTGSASGRGISISIRASPGSSSRSSGRTSSMSTGSIRRLGSPASRCS
jgi:hypothetical protein